MKRLIYTILMALIVGFSANPSFAATSNNHTAKELSAEQQVKLEQMKQRVEEIRDMDKSNLSRAERKALKKELREMNAQARAMTGGGVYLSAGAIIIIILVLILIL